MSDPATRGETDRSDDIRPEPVLPDAIQQTETYRTDEGTVFYDAENPLAWVQTDAPVTLSERV